MAPKTQATSLDLGCGDGVLTSMIGRLDCEVTGVDSCAEAISIARRRLASQKNVDFVVGTVYSLPYPDATFDVVVSSQVIEHLADTKLFLRVIARVLRPGGTAIISTPIRTTEFLSDKEHVSEWFPTEFRAVVDSEMPGAVLSVSHPLALLELQRFRCILRVLLALISLVSNPFIWAGRSWGHYTLQYAVWRRPVVASRE